jgi:transcriptional regulator with XRE-family HTH domain
LLKKKHLYNAYIKEERRAMIYLKIRELCEQRGLSQRQFSLRSGIDENTTRKIFQNPYANINMVTLNRIANFLQVDASALIESHPDS